MGNGRRIGLLITGVSLLIISVVAVCFVDRFNRTHQPTLEALTFSYASPESQEISNESVTELANTVRSYFNEELIVGAELMVIKNRRIVLHETIGWKDQENKIPMDRNTLFNIRSMTKPITGAAIQILIDAGCLRLDSRAAEYLPGFDNENSQNITVEQLLTHRSGLPLSIITTANQYETLISMANETGIIGPEFEPGSKFWYSDAGTEVLGAITEIETGVTLDVFVTEHVLGPLNMNEAFYYHPATQNDSRRDRIADLYINNGTDGWVKTWSSEKPFYPFAFGSQSLYCTPLDYARFLAMWMDEGQAEGTQMLSSEAINRTLTPVSKMSSLGSDMPYPDGFYNLEAYYGQMAIVYSNETNGVLEAEVVGHSGSDGTWAWAWPKLDLIVLYFTQSRGNLSGIKLESKIDELLVHPELKELNNRASEQYAKYLGNYALEFVVTIQNGALAVDIHNQCIFELDEPDEEGKWYFKLMDEIAVSFKFDDNGKVTMMRLYEGGHTYELSKSSIAETLPAR
jgi:CubicO group peptidase (beta-lactamase class C family)